MSVLAGVAGPLLLGAGIHAWARRWCPGLPWSVGVPLWSVLGCAGWLGLASLGGVRWGAPLVISMAAVGVICAASSLRRGVLRRPGFWAVCAAGLAVPQALRVAINPSFGWDFRYIWGLKARVFAAAGGYDWAWLAWSGHEFAHPDYPPAWPDLLASGVLLGADAAVVAAVWQGLLALALAAACWWAARAAPPPKRLLAACVGAWAPIIFAPAHSGYAEPVLAVAAAVALGSLRDLARREPGSLLPLTAGVAVLALTKNEGIALAAGVVAGAAFVERRQGLLAAAGLLPAAAWRLAVGLHGVAGETLDLAPQLLARRMLELPAAVARWLSSPELAILACACVLAAAGVRGRGSRGVLLALGVWLAATAAMYVAGTRDISWWFATSLGRVLAAPLSAVVAIAIAGPGDAAPGKSGPAGP
ncbi:MAG: hypothetical protein LAO05_05155 [Acidobacteriia bacterium]|nr:hypothetical protein [Terriglobia bacterium]